MFVSQNSAINIMAAATNKLARSAAAKGRGADSVREVANSQQPMTTNRVPRPSVSGVSNWLDQREFGEHADNPSQHAQNDDRGPTQTTNEAGPLSGLGQPAYILTRPQQRRHPTISTRIGAKSTLMLFITWSLVVNPIALESIPK